MPNQKTSSISRRSFLKSSVTGLAGAQLLTGTLIHADPEKEKLASSPSPIVRVLGKTGLKAPIVGMGVMNADNPELVRKSFETGIRHFDTAAYYQRGRNEEMVGTVLKELGGRKEAIIATKIYISPAQRSMPAEQVKEFYLKTTEESLKRLQTDYIDILYSHNVPDRAWLTHSGVLDALQSLKKAGKTRFIGFSTHENMSPLIAEAADALPYEVILTTFNYSLADDGSIFKALQQAAARGIGLIAMKTQCQQGWYREGIEAANKEMYQKYYSGTLINTALLKWALSHPFIACAIPGFTSFQQLEEDFSVASNLAFNAEEKKFLQDRQIKLAMQSVCQRCRQCTSQCPNGADIAELIRVHMYAAVYNNFLQARQVLSEIPLDRGLQVCRQCASCQAECSRRVRIDRRIAELKTIFA